MAWRLLVIDGADQGRDFPLPAAGTVLVGNSRKHADVCLNDLYVARVHCHVEVAGDRVVVKHAEGNHETLVNGKKILTHELKPGEVLRAGNSHLRLEVCDAAADAAADAATAKVPSPRERLEELTDRPLGHYQLGSVVGRGYCGVVFQAKDVKGDRRVALKVLSPEFPKNDAEMQTFVAAVKKALPLRHPQLVAL